MKKEVLKNRAKLCAKMPVLVVIYVCATTLDFLQEVWYGIQEGAERMKEERAYFLYLVKRVWKWEPENEEAK